MSLTRPQRRMLASLVLLVLSPLILLAVLSGLEKEPRTGLVEGRLSPCPPTPNCVSSEVDTRDEARVQPLRFAGPPGPAWESLQAAVQATGGVIREQTEGYLHAVYTSRIFRFQDDLECRLDDAEGVIHIRSASRIGHGDLGANRRRVERLRRAFPAS